MKENEQKIAVLFNEIYNTYIREFRRSSSYSKSLHVDNIHDGSTERYFYSKNILLIGKKRWGSCLLRIFEPFQTPLPICIHLPNEFANCSFEEVQVQNNVMRCLMLRVKGIFEYILLEFNGPNYSILQSVRRFSIAQFAKSWIDARLTPMFSEDYILTQQQGDRNNLNVQLFFHQKTRNKSSCMD